VSVSIISNFSNKQNNPILFGKFKEFSNFSNQRKPCLAFARQGKFFGKRERKFSPPSTIRVRIVQFGSPIKAIAVLLYCPTKPYPPIQEMALKKLKSLPPTIYSFTVVSFLSFGGSVASLPRPYFTFKNGVKKSKNKYSAK
jgi:hypothetical protein